MDDQKKTQKKAPKEELNLDTSETSLDRPSDAPTDENSTEAKHFPKTVIVNTIIIGILVAFVICLIYSLTQKPIQGAPSNNQGSIVEKPDESSDNSNESEEKLEEDEDVKPSEEKSPSYSTENRTIPYLGDLECHILNDGTQGDYCTIPPSKILNDDGETTYAIHNIENPERLSPEGIGTIEQDGESYIIKIKAGAYDEQKTDETKTIIVSFDQPVVHYGVGGFGQGVGDECAFFVMKDGSLSFLRLDSVIRQNATVAKRIDAVSEIATLMNGNICTLLENGAFGGCGHTIFAIRNDGTGYNLWSFIRE